MKRFLTLLLLGILSTSGAVQAQAVETPLKLAFQRARATGNIEEVFPALKSATLYVVAGSSGPPNEAHDLFITKSPKNGRMCVTVSESESYLAKVSWPKRVISGEHLLRHLPKAMEIIVVYPDGGDYVTQEQMEWFRGMLGKP